MSKTDYDLTTLRGIVFDVDGVLSPDCVPLGEDGVPRRMANMKDGFAIKTAVDNGLNIAILTGGNDPAVVKRYKMLGVNSVMMVSGPKLPYFRQWMADNGLEPSEVAYVGDDIPDVKCMYVAGLSVAPADAAVDIRSMARYVTSAKGGYGVARELLEQILRAQCRWPGEADAFGQ